MRLVATEAVTMPAAHRLNGRDDTAVVLLTTLVSDRSRLASSARLEPVQAVSRSPSSGPGGTPSALLWGERLVIVRSANLAFVM